MVDRKMQALFSDGHSLAAQGFTVVKVQVIFFFFLTLQPRVE